MKERVSFLVIYFLFWVAFFEVARILFLMFHAGAGEGLAATDWLLILVYGARMDMSMAGYFSLFPAVLLLLSSFFNLPGGYRLIHGYTYLLLVMSAIVILTDIELYTHWNFRLDATPLLYVGEDTPLAISAGRLVFLVIMALFLVSLAILVYQKLIARRFSRMPAISWIYAPVFLLLVAILILPIRGGTGIAPMNTGMVYFHPTSLFANHAALNVLWNVGYSLKDRDARLPENVMDTGEADILMARMQEPSPGPGVAILGDERPNILLIILESITSNTIGLTYQDKLVTPNLTRLSNESVYFNHFYASGTRTDKGIVSVLNAYPTQPTVSIIKYPAKTQTLPYLNKTLAQEGYRTSFTYGGDIDFANFRSYLNNARFDEVTSSSDFPEELNTSKWGVHDEYVFDRVLEECGSADDPFFKTVLTLSSHEPFTVPGETVFEGTSEEAMFLNSVHYTDRELGRFLESARASSWWENTWVIITSDHGHRLPGEHDLTDPARYHIPLIWTGGAVDTSAVNFDVYGDQTDLAATVLAQLGIPSDEFIFSQDILGNRLFRGALYIYNNGFGAVGPDTDIVYDHTAARWIREQGPEDQKGYARALIQRMHEDFNRR